MGVHNTSLMLYNYEIGDLFSWEMLTKMMISYLLNVEKTETRQKWTQVRNLPKTMKRNRHDN